MILVGIWAVTPPLCHQRSRRGLCVFGRAKCPLLDSGSKEDADELATFGWWLASGKFPDGWAIAQAMPILEYLRSLRPDFAVVERSLRFQRNTLRRRCAHVLDSGEVKQHLLRQPERGTSNSIVRSISRSGCVGRSWYAPRLGALSDASYASRRTAARRKLMVAGASRRDSSS